MYLSRHGHPRRRPANRHACDETRRSCERSTSHGQSSHGRYWRKMHIAEHRRPLRLQLVRRERLVAALATSAMVMRTNKNNSRTSQVAASREVRPPKARHETRLVLPPEIKKPRIGRALKRWARTWDPHSVSLKGGVCCWQPALSPSTWQRKRHKGTLRTTHSPLHAD